MTTTEILDRITSIVQNSGGGVKHVTLTSSQFAKLLHCRKLRNVRADMIISNGATDHVISITTKEK